MKAIEINNLTVTLKGKEALRNISLSLDEGKFIGIVGPNGGGKTTLLRTVLGLARPASGTIRIFGKSPDEVLKSGSVFGYLPQISKISPDFPVRVIDVVMMGRYGKVGMLRWPGEEDREKCPGVSFNDGNRRPQEHVRSVNCPEGSSSGPP